MDFRPFRPLCPSPAIASRLVSPPYDVVSTPEARALAGNEPFSFLRVTRAELELPDDHDAYAADVYARGRANLDALVGEGALIARKHPAWAVYRQTRGAHAQLGLVGLASVTEYERGLVKRHELTRAEKEDDRTRHIDVTEAQTGPVFLAMRASTAMEDLLIEASLGRPDLDAWMDNGVRHEAWFIDADSPRGARLATLLAEVPASYIADGHHRAASAMRVARLRREQGHKDGPWEHFLAVVFPSNWLKILPYNRVVADLHGHSEAAFLEALAPHFDVGSPGASPIPTARHRVAMYLGGTWRELAMKGVDESDAIASLDVAFLQDKLLEPVLGIADPRRDHRIDFVGGIRGTRTLEERAGAHGVAFSMYPTSLDELFRVADADAIMPPKSTWFEPKLADGLFVHDISRSPR
jgi:uncharacterized protein (DUF1015 family)